MKIKLTAGAAMLLTLGSAVAGGLILQKDVSRDTNEFIPTSTADNMTEATPEQIAKWKLTAATSDYSPPMLPI
jgi:hypothetical protein